MAYGGRMVHEAATQLLNLTVCGPGSHPDDWRNELFDAGSDLRAAIGGSGAWYRELDNLLRAKQDAKPETGPGARSNMGRTNGRAEV